MKALALAWLLPVAAATAQQSRGHLFIVGGGTQPASLVSRFVELAGGPGVARIAVVPMASSDPGAAGEEKAAQLREFGADAFVLLLSRDEAESSTSVPRLDGVTGIWFNGGDQSRLVLLLQATPVLDAMRARYHAGAAVGGTSAGAAALGDSMITGNQRRPGADTAGYYGDQYPVIARGAIEVVAGLGFLSGTIIDQHFLWRERHNRLLAVVLERPGLLGAGIDESTALEVGPDGQWSVRGTGAVLIYDARPARLTPSHAPLGAADVRMHLLPSGAGFLPSSGRATLPAR